MQAIHGFDSVEHAQAYLTSDLFVQKVAPGLKPIWDDDPDVRIYSLWVPGAPDPSETLQIFM